MTDRRASIERLARIVGALRRGDAITLPYVPGARGTQWSETFQKGVWQGDRETTLLHRMDYIDKQGAEHIGRSEPTEWDLDAMLDQSGEWDEATIDALPGIDEVSQDPAVRLVLSLLEGPKHISTMTTLVERDDNVRIETQNGGQWQLADLIMMDWSRR